MPKIYFHVDVNSAFLSWSALKALQGGSTVDLRTIPAAGKKHPGEKIRHPDGGEPLCRPRQVPGADRRAAGF